ANFLKHGPTDEELERSRMSSRAGFIRGLEKVGGFSGKATVLAESQVYRGDPAAYKLDLARIQQATPETVKAAANRWLAKGDYTLTVVPVAEGEAIDDAAPKGLPVADGKPAAVMPAKADYSASKSTLDRSSGVPKVSDFPDLSFPKIQRGVLKNGIEIALAERHTIPVVQMQLQFDAGYASDQGRKLGTSSFAMALLDEGTLTLDSVEIARRSELLGARISAGSGLDSSSVSLNALTSELEASLALYADIVRNPAFREADIERIRGQWLADIAQEKTQPTGIALRTLPPLLYGDQHAYGIPFTGSGTEASIKSLDVKDLRRFHREFIRPDNLKILIAGDTTLAEITRQLDKVFGDWQATETPVPVKAIANVDAPTKARVFLIDRPDSPQSLILTGSLAPSTTVANNIEIQTMNGIFGGTFTSRLNMNLREDKRWAYGASSFLQDAIGQRPFMTYASVQTDKTAESAAEVLKEARAVIGDKPITDEEIARIKAQRIRALPGSFETTGSVLGILSGNALYSRPDDYVQTLKARLQGQTKSDIEAAARAVIKPDALTWVIVGDLKKIEAPVRALKLGDVKVMDADGKVLR
ncbi:MAG: insulinase family protein, partial [Dokdonella sp.]|uniref:M16 family metallopeptidase n=2 Tax=Dokdonella sp. TaxID=2291710 RepID=UPI003BAFEC11